MIKNILKVTLRVMLIIGMIIPYFQPITIAANSGQTIQDMKEELAYLESEKTRLANSKQLTQNEINSINNNIYNMRNEQAQIEEDVAAAKIKIEESEAKIAQLNTEIEALLKYYQLTKGDEIFNDYLSDADNLKDLIRRLEAVEQITAYTDKTIEDLNILIDENIKLQEELALRDEELANKIVEISSELTKLNGDLLAITDTSMDIDDQIENQEKQIKYYQSICPSETVAISTCETLGTSYGWLKPITSGVLTSYWGVRISPITGNTEGHAAVDMANKLGTTIYSTSNGRVSNVFRTSCGGNQVHVHVNVNGINYTVEYAHLQTVSVKEGQTISANTVIGTMGGTTGGYDKCTGGVHLHYNVSKGHYGVDYGSWSTYIANSVNINSFFPTKGTWWYSR